VPAAKTVVGVALIAVTLTVCASSAAETRWRRPTPHERTTIARDVGWAWRVTDMFAADRRRGLHPVVGDVRISRTDRHFAGAAVRPLNGHGKQVAETATVVLMQATGRWLIVIGPMTDVAVVCQAPAPQPVRELYC
jgi:hypothetical protein